MSSSYNPNTANPLTLAINCYRKGWFKWNTRATRREFWWSFFILNLIQIPFFIWLISSVLEVASRPYIFDSNVSNVISFAFYLLLLVLYQILFFIPGMGAYVRRGHDVGLSGWQTLIWMLLSAIPLVGIIFLIIFIVILCKDSQPGANAWGCSPKYAPQNALPTQNRESMQITWKNVLSCNGYYSRTQFLVHVTIGALIASICLYIFDDIIGSLYIFDSIIGNAVFESIYSACFDVIVDEAAYILLFFFLIAFPAFVKRLRDIGHTSLLPVIWISLYFILEILFFVINLVEGYVDNDSFAHFFRSFRFVFGSFSSLLWLVFTLIIFVSCLSKSAPMAEEKSIPLRKKLNWLYIVLLVLAFPVNQQSVYPRCVFDNVSDWLRVRCCSHKDFMKRLKSAVLLEDVDKVREMLELERLSGSELNDFIKDRLYYEDNQEILKLLLAAPGIDVNMAGEDGETPLYRAAYKGHTEVVRLLLATPGIDVNMANEDGETPLYWAAYKGHTEVVRLLLAAPGIDVNKANRWGRTPLDEAKTVQIRSLLRAAGGKTGRVLRL